MRIPFSTLIAECSNQVRPDSLSFSLARIQDQILPGILEGILDDHGGLIGRGQGVAAEGVAPREVPRRKHARAIADDDFVRVQQRHQCIGGPKDCACELDDVLCTAQNLLLSAIQCSNLIATVCPVPSSCHTLSHPAHQASQNRQSQCLIPAYTCRCPRYAHMSAQGSASPLRVQPHVCNLPANMSPRDVV